MFKFSDESKLLIKNWETVQNILDAEKQIRKEFSLILYDLESKLSKLEWWDNSWNFEKYGDSQIYITNRQWKHNGEDLIWIGIENFVPERIFGIQSPPNLYIWVPSGNKQLVKMFQNFFDKYENHILGEIDTRASGYVVKHFVRKFIPEEIDKFEKIVSKQILDFFSYYANFRNDIKRVIKDYFKTDKK